MDVTSGQSFSSALNYGLFKGKPQMHCDFSENYLVKYAEETQSFHFGGSRKQISIHTVVVYTKVGGKTVPKSYCTLSDSLNHGPAAIWAHLIPILNEYLFK
nr:unnamed protein product [Callosobruchus chinensis]